MGLNVPFCLEVSLFFSWLRAIIYCAPFSSVRWTVFQGVFYKELLFLLFICSIMSDSWWPPGLKHSRILCPSTSPGTCSDSCPLIWWCHPPSSWWCHPPSSWWCHPTISSYVVPFSSCLQSSPASGSFPVCQFFALWPKYWSFNFSISPSNEYSGLISFRMDWLYLPAVQGTLKSLL